MINPKISIIIPIYNAEAYLNECIESIIHQHFQNFELILVNDGSTDTSKHICDQFAESFFQIKKIHLTNGGASRARNKGLEEARGEYIWFIDADDWIDSDFLSDIDWDHLPDILYFGFKRILSSSYEICAIPDRIIECSYDLGNTLNNLFTSKEQFFGFTWNKIFKRRIIEDNKIRFRENLIIKEDEVFTLEYCKHIKSIGILKATPYNYRILSDSVSHSKNKKRNMYELVSFLENDINDSNYPEPLRKSIKETLVNYYKEALKEKSGDSVATQIMNKFIYYLKKNRRLINLSGKDKVFMMIPTNYLKQKLFYLYQSTTK